MIDRAGMALLALALTTAPLTGSAQTVMTGSQQAAALRYALAHFDSEVQTLANLKNHIPVRDIVTVNAGSAQRSAMSRRGGRLRHDALMNALNKATVADVDMKNGQSEDQSSLADHLVHLTIDPNKVIAVDVNLKDDPQNPHVTVFYRK